MTFERYWSIVVKRWHIVLVCFLVVGLGTFVGSKIMKPVYQSSTLVEVTIRSFSNNQSDYNSLLASDQLVQTEADLVTTNSVLSEVASHYPDLTVKQLAAEVSSTTKLNTQLFEIDVVDESPSRAAELANDIAATLIKQQRQAAQQDNAQAQQQIQQDLDQTRQQISSVTKQISALQTGGGNQGKITLLQAQLNGLQQHYSQWQASLAQLELDQAQSQDFLQVAQPALPDNSPIRPIVPLYTAIGFLVGLLLGMVLVLAIDQLDTRVRTQEDIAQLLEWPVLASIWRTKSSSDVLNPVGKNINSEPFRILRTNIGFSSIDRPLRTLVVTSAEPKDGKSSIAANLAIFMAKAGKSTLLIDADLRLPMQHVLFKLSPDALGLSNAIIAFSRQEASKTPDRPPAVSPQFILPQIGPGTSGFSLEPFVHPVGIPNLWVMPSGPLPPNPSEFLESKVMQRFLTMVATSGIEIVILDTPPLLGLSDTTILVSKVDGTLVVVNTMRATKEKLKRIQAILSQTGTRVLGCVANKLPYKRSDSAYYYYYTSDQDSEEKPSGNGHRPASPVAQVPASPVEQRGR